MIGGLRANLVGTIMATTAVLVLTLVLLEDPLVEYRVTEEVRRELAQAATDVDAALDRGEPPDEIADRIGASTASHVRIVGEDGRLLGDTAAAGARLAEQPPLEDAIIDEARASGRAVDARKPGDGDRVLWLAQPTGDGRVVVVSRPLATVEAARDGVRELLLVAGLLAVAIGGVLTLVLSRTMVGPVRQLTRVANELAAGDLDARTRSERSDELGTLGRSIDQMAEQLAERVHTLRAEEARLRTVLDAMVEAVFVTDRRGEIVLTNTALDRLAGGDPRGRTAVEAIRSAELHEAVRRARRGDAVEVELELRVGGSDRRWLSAQVAPLPGDAGVVAVLHDVTKLKLADRVRRDFVANASHELRTPLTAVRGFAETLRDGASKQPETATRFAEMIVKHTLRLERLVEDLLALSRAESPDEHYELDPIDAGAIAAEVVRGLEPQAVDKGIDVEVESLEGLPRVRGNERALDQILFNLLDNAIKYTAEGSVTVRGVVDEDHVTIEVQDTGPGISTQHLERIFERFYRVDKGRSRAVGGTGLGLSIVKHLASRMQAEVDVDSGVGRGTTFRVTIARAGSERLAEPEAKEAVGASASGTGDALG